MRFRFGWNGWLFVVVWAVAATLLFPSVVHRLAARDGFWDGGFVQGTGILLVVLRLAQSVLEAAILGAIYGFLACVVLLAVLMFLGRIAMLLKGEAKLSELFSLPLKRSVGEWTMIACSVVLSAAVFPLVTHWILWSNYAVVRSVGPALISFVGPAWLLMLLWLVYKPAGRSR